MTRALLLLFAFNGFLPCVSGAYISLLAQEVSAEKKAKPARYMGRTIAETMSYHGGSAWLVRPERQDEENQSLLLEQLELKPGQVICDLGCGVGYHTIPIAKRVAPEGKVYAVDIQIEMLQALSQNANHEGVENIESILSEQGDPKLPEHSIDLILLVDVYHEFSDPETMLAKMQQALKPDGMIALVEFRREDPRIPIHPLHKMTKSQILKEYEANGFRLIKEFDGLPRQHLMFMGMAPPKDP